MAQTVKKAVRAKMRTSKAGRSNDPSGFTLVELAVVLLIILVALGLVLPQTSSLFIRSDLKASTRRLAGAVAYARSQAMLEGRLWELTLDLDNTVFWTAPSEETGEFDTASANKRVLPGDIRFKDVILLDREARISGSIPIRFHPRGLAEAAVIHLASPGDQVQTLLIKSFNGRVNIYDGYVGTELTEG
jgi:prepilin-type N-terminal cleavage/methylation domain-containing protein